MLHLNFTSFEEASFLFQEGTIVFTPYFTFPNEPYYNWTWRPNVGSELKYEGLYIPEGLNLRNARQTAEFAIREQKIDRSGKASDATKNPDWH